MFEASKTKEVRFVDALVQYGALVNVKDPVSGSTPLHVAFSLGLNDLSKLLLSYGADPNATDKKSKRAIDVAASASIKDMYDKWLKDGAMAFDDPPGTWTRLKDDKGQTYYHSDITREGRWNVPPALAWQRAKHPNGPSSYSNYVTNQVSAYESYNIYIARSNPPGAHPPNRQSTVSQLSLPGGVCSRPTRSFGTIGSPTPPSMKSPTSSLTICSRRPTS